MAPPHAGYSHRDTRWAKWLHGALEGYRIDKELVGRTTAQGPIPKALRPIFRDRNDFTAGHSLNEETLAALDASAALIVLCSPAAVASCYVNVEVALFRERHPERPVIPVIVDGAPGDPERECFPPALHAPSRAGNTEESADASGALAAPPDGVVAADARVSGDGRELALARIAARLLGLEPDDVFRRAERERRRKARWRNAVIAVLALLAVTATGSAVYAWQQLTTNEAFLNATLKRATQIIDEAVAQAEKYNVPRAATLSLLTKAEGLFDDMAQYGRPTPELRYRKAWMLIQFARNYEILGDTSKQFARANEAQRLLMGLANEKTDDLTYQRDLSVAYHGVGAVLVAQGNLPEALKSFRDGLAITEPLAKADPNNAGWQGDLTVSYDSIGNVLVAQGNLPEALKSYREGLAIRERLAKADPSNARWQRDLSISYDRIGHVLAAQGNLPEALKSLRYVFAIAEWLAKADPSNAGWQRNLGYSYNRLGEVLEAQGNLPEALKSFRDGLAIAEVLAKADPSNAGWQRDLMVSYDRIGHVLKERGNLPEALKSYHDAFAIAERLAKADPSDAVLRGNLTVSYYRIGDVLEMQGNLPEALKSYRESLAIRERLVKTDPSNALLEANISVSYSKIGDVLEAQGNLPEALKFYRDGLPIAERLAKADPSDVRLRNYLQFMIGRIGTLAYSTVLAGDFTSAFEAVDQVVPLAPDRLWLHVNRAHALMFLGRVEEARSIYLGHRGAKNVVGEKSWETVVTEDFAELRKAKLMHPLMDEIEKRFAAPR